MASKLLSAETYREYVEDLIKNGSSVVGEGAFSMVFEHPEYRNLVLKVVKKDARYLEFARFCQKHPSNPWLPRVKDIKAMPFDDSRQAYVVILEKLQVAKASDVQRMIISLKTEFELKYTDASHWFTREDWRHLGANHKEDPDFAVVASYLKHHYKELDLRVPNFMARGQQLVFNDPVA